MLRPGILLFALLFTSLFLLPVAGEWGQYIVTYDHPQFYKVDTRGMKWAEVTLKATVLSGDRVDIFLVNDENLTTYVNSSHIYYIKEGSSLNTTDFSCDVILPGGRVYWFIFQVHVERNESVEEARRKAATVSYEISVEEVEESSGPYYLLLLGIVFLLLGAILIVKAKLRRIESVEERGDVRKKERPPEDRTPEVVVGRVEDPPLGRRGL